MRCHFCLVFNFIKFCRFDCAKIKLIYLEIGSELLNNCSLKDNR